MEGCFCRACPGRLEQSVLNAEVSACVGSEYLLGASYIDFAVWIFALGYAFHSGSCNAFSCCVNCPVIVAYLVFCLFVDDCEPDGEFGHDFLLNLYYRPWRIFSATNMVHISKASK